MRLFYLRVPTYGVRVYDPDGTVNDTDTEQGTDHWPRQTMAAADALTQNCKVWQNGYVYKVIIYLYRFYIFVYIFEIPIMFVGMYLKPCTIYISIKWIPTYRFPRLKYYIVANVSKGKVKGLEPPSPIGRVKYKQII